MKFFKFFICILFFCTSINLFATEHICVNSQQTYSNQTFSNYAQVSPLLPLGGGVFYVYTEGSLNINDINFSTNLSKYGGGAILNRGVLNVNSSFFSSNTAQTFSGGAIINSQGIVVINSSRFIENTASDYGGAISNADGRITISSSIFSKNQTKLGGAIDNYNGIIDVISSVFSENFSTSQGGAILNRNKGNIIISSCSFTDNTSKFFGGAIDNFDNSSIVTIQDNTRFINNKAAGTYGGAIYNKGILNLIANTGNIEFTGNTANGVSNAIHDSYGTINLWASSNADIIFNDRITSTDNTSILNINSSTTTLTANGKTILNEDMSGYLGQVNLYDGEIELQAKTEENSNINTNKFFSGDINLSSGALNILNNAIDNITISTWTSTSNANLKIDTDLSNNTNDNFTITNSAEGVLNLTAINILGVNETSGQITLFNSYKSPLLNILTTANYGGYEYTFTNSDILGVLNYENTGIVAKTFKEVINTTEPAIRSYSLVNDEVVTEDIENLGGIELSIFGNSYDVISQDSLEGIYISKDKVLNIENVNNWSGFNNTYGAIKNEGTLNISGTNFSNNDSQDIINNGILFLDGICYFERGIIGQGTTIIKGEVTSCGTISNFLNINSNGKLINNGKLIVNNGINNGTIEQTKNISNMTIIGEFVNNNIISQKNIYLINATLQQTINSNLECDSLIISNSTIYLTNSILQENNFKNLTINDNLNLFVDADLENKKMDTISTDSFTGKGKINIKTINLLTDAKENKTEVLFTSSTVLKDKITTAIDTASSKLFKYDVNYDKNTGNFNFLLTQNSNPIIAESQVASVSGLITQTTVLNQAFSSIENIRNRIIQAKQKGLLYASTADMLFDNTNRIESGLWIRPFMSQDTINLDNLNIDNTLTGTLAGLDLAAGENTLLSFYLGYAGSNQKYEDIKVNQTGYIVGATGMYIKEKWYAGLTANINFNKAESESDYGTDSFDMNMYSVGAKAGYNFDLSEKFVLEPNLTLMYGNVSNQEYETTQGAKIDSQSVANIMVEPQVKAKLNLTNGWQPYGLLGYLINAGEKAKLMADNIAFDDMGISGYVECGLGVNKTFKNSSWSCYLQLTGKSGDVSGFDGNIGIKYSFLNKKEKEDIELIKYTKKKEKEEKARLEAEEKARIEEEKRLKKEEQDRQKVLEQERIKLEKEEQEKQRLLEIERKLQENYN